MSKEVSANEKPFVNICTIGDDGHGKTTLTAAISSILAKITKTQRKPFDHFGKVNGKGVLGNSRSTSYIEYATENRNYAHVDFPDFKELAKNMISGTAFMDGAILVVSATEGLKPQTREHLLLARQVGVPAIVVFLNKLDQLDNDELVEPGIRNLLSEYGFNGDKVPIVKGSALKALEGESSMIADEAILKLMEACDTYIPLPSRLTDKPFLMPVEDVLSSSNRGTVVAGRIDRGIVNVGDKLEIVGYRDTIKTTVTEIEMFQKLFDEAHAGDSVCCLMRGISKEEVERGQVLAAPGSIRSYKRFKAEVYILTNEEGGRSTPFFNGYSPQFFFRTLDLAGTCILPDGIERVMPGDKVSIEVTLGVPIALEKKMHFDIRENGSSIGTGVVTEIITDSSHLS